MGVGSSVTPIRYDQVQFALVTEVVSPTSFVAGGLAGFDTTTFAGYSVWVLSKADKTSTAPKGEAPKLISSFIGNDGQYPLVPGTIIHLAFTSPLQVGDSVLLLNPYTSPSVLAQLGLIMDNGTGTFNGLTDSLKAIAAAGGGGGGGSDAVYLNTLEGVPGTASPIGDPFNPVNNIVDALLIAGDRGISKIVLSGGRSLDGTHTGALNPTVMTDDNIVLVPGRYVGWLIVNNTDGSSGTITANTEHTVTAVLAGGGLNTWTPGDTWAITNLTSGTHAGPLSADVLVDPAANWSPNSLIGQTIANTTDGSTGFISSNTAHTVTVGALIGGGLNVWTPGDVWQLDPLPYDLMIVPNPIGATIIELTPNSAYSIKVVDPTASGARLIFLNGLACYELLNTDATIEIQGDLKTVGQVYQAVGAGEITVLKSIDCGGSVGNDAVLTVFGAIHARGVANGLGELTAEELFSFNGEVRQSGSGLMLIYGRCELNGAASGGSLRIVDNGSILEFGSLKASYVENLTDSSITINGDCILSEHITNTGAGELIILGDLNIKGDADHGEGYFDNSTGGAVRIGGNVFMSRNFTPGLNPVEIYGNLTAGDVITVDPNGDLRVQGDLQAMALNVYSSARARIRGDCLVGDGGITVMVQGLLICRRLRTTNILNDGSISAFEIHASALNHGTQFTGTQTEANNPTVMTDAAANFLGIDSLVGSTIYNITDGSQGVVTANDPTSITVGALIGGGLNIWTTGDQYSVRTLNYLDCQGDCLVSGHIVNASEGMLSVTGNLRVTGDPSLTEGYIENTVGLIPFGNVVLFVGGDCQIAAGLRNDAAVVSIKGNLQVGGTVSPGGGPPMSIEQTGLNGKIVVTGNVVVGDHIQNTLGKIYIYGDLTIRGSSTEGEGYFTNGPGAGDIQITGNADISGDVSNPPVTNFDVGGTLHCGSLANEGSMLIGSLKVDGQLLFNGAGAIAVINDMRAGSVVSSAAGTIGVGGDVHLAGLDNTGGGDINIGGNATIVIRLINPAAIITIKGVLHCYGNITNTGTLTYFGIYPEQKVAIDAILASETDFVNLWETDRQFTINDLVLKCADPGADTVTVRYSRLVNGVLTQVDSFDITAANFNTYFSLMDMFGKPLLAGNAILITVQASGGGPYAVEGSYTVRSDESGSGSTGVVPG